MHKSEAFREPVLTAFDCRYPSPDEVISSLGGTEKAREVLGRLWNCSDILPSNIIDIVHTDWPDAGRMRGTFGALSQWMIRYMEQ